MKKWYHIGFPEAPGARYAILPGDPGRVEKIAVCLEKPRFYSQNREYTTWLGELDGDRVLVMSTGMGGPSTAIGVEELHTAGVRTCIRVGTCGGMQTQVRGGDLVIANAAIRMEGTSREYAPIEFPAVSDFAVTAALREAAQALGVRLAERVQTAGVPDDAPEARGTLAHTGVVHCKDSFYGQHDPGRMPVGCDLQQKWEAWIKAGCLASEMESAALYIAAQTLGMRAGCVLSVVWNQERARLGLDNPERHDSTLAIRTAVEAVRRLIAAERR